VREFCFENWEESLASLVLGYNLYTFFQGLAAAFHIHSYSSLG